MGVPNAAQGDQVTQTSPRGDVPPIGGAPGVGDSLEGGTSFSDAGLTALPPHSIPGYEILGEIHRGGQGVVYQAMQKSTRRTVAIKVMKEGPFAGPADKARFDREVQILGQLNHPYVVTIHDSGQAVGHYYFVMDYVAGLPLDAYIAGGTRSIDDTLRLFCKICDAVNAAHLRGIIHRDLKPGNIRVDPEGNPHVLDFGLAKLSLGEATDATQPATLSITGQFIGSLPWASPEQAEAIPGNVDVRTDVYSLGVILYQMLTGRFPYEVVGNMRDVLDRIIKAEPARPSTIRRQINNEVETIVLKCLGKSRDRRYQNAGELGRDIGHYLAGEPIEAKRDSAWYVLRKHVQRHKIPALVATAFALLLIAFAVTSSLQAERNRMLATDARERLSDAMVERGIRLLESDDQHGLLYLLEARTLVDHDPDLSTARAGLWAAWHQGFEDRFVRSIGETEPITAFYFSEDGQHLITGAKNFVTTWDIATGNRVGNPIQVDADVIQTFLGEGNILQVQKKRDQFYWDLSEARRWNPPAIGDQGGPRIWDANTGKELAHLRGHEGWVASARFSPDGTRIITASADKTARVWDASTGVELAALRGHDEAVGSAQFSRDGTRIVTSSKDKTARIWDAATGSELRVLRGHEDTVRTPQFSPDGHRILTASNDKTARVWDADSGVELVVLRGHEDGVLATAFSPDGARIVTSSMDKTARIWDATTGTELKKLGGHESWVNTAAFSSDGARILTVSSPTIRVWNATTGQEIAGLRGHKGFASPTAAFSPDGTRVVSASIDKTARLWDANTGQELFVLRGHEHEVWSPSFSPDGTRIVTPSLETTARVWDAQSGAELVKLEGFERMAVAAFSPDGTRIVTASGLFSMDRPWERRTAPGSIVSGSENFNVSPDGQWLFERTADGMARVFDVRTGRSCGKPLHISPTKTIFDVIFSPGGKFLATTGMESQIWNVTTAEPWGPPLGQRGAKISFSSDGRFAAVRTLDKQFAGVAILVDLETGQQRGKTLPIGGGVPETIYSLPPVFSPDGKLLATQFESKIELWDIASTELRGTPIEHGTKIRHVTFSPDGQLLATAGADNAVRLWDMPDGNPHGAPLKHQEPITRMQFSPEGSFLATLASSPGGAAQVRLWPSSGARHAGERPLPHGASVAMNLVFSDDGRFLVADGAGGTVHVIELRTMQSSGAPIRAFAQALALSPDAQRLATCREIPTPPQGGRMSSSFAARLWDVSTGNAIGDPIPVDGMLEKDGGIQRDHPRAMAFSPDGRLLAVLAGASATIGLWDTASGKPQGEPLRWDRYTGDLEPTWMRIRFSRSGDRVFANEWFGTWIGWDLHERKALTFDGPIVAVSRDGDRLVVLTRSDEARELRLYDCTKGAFYGMAMPAGQIAAYGGRALLNADGSRLAVVSRNSAAMYSGDDGTPIGPQMRFPSQFGTAALSPDGRLLAATFEDTAQVWETTTGHAYGAPRKLDGDVLDVQFSPDGRWLTTWSESGENREPSAGGRQLFQLPEPPDHLRPMQLRTWLLLASRLTPSGVVEPIPPTEFQSLQDELARSSVP